MKKVLIAGAKGMLGGELVKVFQSDGAKVLAWDVEELDITNREEVLEKIEEASPDIVINAAAYNAVDKAEESAEEFEKALKINAEGPKNLAIAAQKTGATLIHYVSDYVFSGNKEGYVENDKPDPISNYGKSKAAGGAEVEKIGGKYYLIRTSKIFGDSANHEGAKKSFFEIMMNLAEERDEIKVIDSERSCFTYAPDLAEATKDLLKKKYDYGTYHIVNEGAVTWYEGVLELFKIAGIENIKVNPVSSEEFPRLAKRPASSVLINTKFSKLRHYPEAIRDWLK
ncbi:MAG: dTDP-4-dehydrorhamnose reductase [Patescibacteria group bacterium]